MNENTKHIKQESARIKDTYHASMLADNRPYKVEINDGYLPYLWRITKWNFPTEQDAIAYCKNETKNFPARVVLEHYDKATNTITPELIYTKM